MTTHWRTKLQAIGWGALGVTLVLVALHLYVDHMALHAVFDALHTQATAVRGQ